MQAIAKVSGIPGVPVLAIADFSPGLDNRSIVVERLWMAFLQRAMGRSRMHRRSGGDFYSCSDGSMLGMILLPLLD